MCQKRDDEMELKGGEEEEEDTGSVQNKIRMKFMMQH